MELVLVEKNNTILFTQLNETSYIRRFYTFHGAFMYTGTNPLSDTQVDRQNRDLQFNTYLNVRESFLQS